MNVLIITFSCIYQFIRYLIPNTRTYKKQVLLPAVYGVNRSFSKQVITGFSLNLSGSLSPVICIVNQDYSGVEFEPTEWAIITDRFPVIGKFFTAEDNIKEVPEAFNTPILMPTHELAFTYSYGERAIIIKPAMPVSTDNDGLGIKRARTYTPTVFMKRVSYLNLQRVLRCVTFQITSLREITHSANNCKDTLIAELDRRGDDTSSRDNILGDLRLVLEKKGLWSPALNQLLLELLSLYNHEYLSFVRSTMEDQNSYK
ncbi:uncharacterized protein LOC112494401 isoform X2 [Cephus cinctus]|uniref:Uncharacterized protein LOC112494401 isoform X1 n=1 Tax=Cephus cinctus TaxID=211228 RepID=A0AAJ7RHL0_CEPCN|nr:uncharacterized protein LOC112494401 isoform X1 [Cephus cinctus]XP_024941127.1 uncharacterized protein LOC112494401 isoform X2 [Cephus cinctus]